MSVIVVCPILELSVDLAALELPEVLQCRSY